MDFDILDTYLLPYLTGADLGRIAKVCKEWNRVTKCNSEWQEFKTHWHVDVKFEQMCAAGRVYIVKYLYTKCGQVDRSRGFVQACKYGQLAVAKWLYIFGISKCSRARVWEFALKNCQLEIVKWLLEITPLHYIQRTLEEVNKKYLYERSCRFGCVEMIEFFMSLNTTKYLYDSGFEVACIHGHLKVAQLLHSHKSGFIDYHDVLNRVFAYDQKNDATHAGQVEVAKWLLETQVNINIFRVKYMWFCDEYGHRTRYTGGYSMRWRKWIQAYPNV
jgi:hypothetical protein